MSRGWEDSGSRPINTLHGSLETDNSPTKSVKVNKKGISLTVALHFQVDAGFILWFDLEAIVKHFYIITMQQRLPWVQHNEASPTKHWCAMNNMYFFETGILLNTSPTSSSGCLLNTLEPWVKIRTFLVFKFFQIYSSGRCKGQTRTSARRIWGKFS